MPIARRFILFLLLVTIISACTATSEPGVIGTSTTTILATATATTVPPLLPAAEDSTIAGLGETTSIDVLNPDARIKIPFVRDGDIYLYEDGIEKLVAKPEQQTSPQACLSIFYPALSPNGKFLAYIEQAGEPPDEYWGCSAGFLQVVDISTGISKPTDYRITYFRWTPDNLLNFMLERELIETPPQHIDREIFFDPETQTESVFETIIDRDPNTGAEMLLSAAYPSDDLSKLIRFEDEKYYLVDNARNEETFLFEAAQVTTFLDWSPSGRYAIFASTKVPGDDFEVIEFVFDTQNLGASVMEITVGRGAAGGDLPAGRKWYFEEGFVPYCREELYFVDDSPPWQLTNDGGGGCNNEEGFVATSPNGEYAFIKFKDRFELHDTDGNVAVVQETEALAKGRGAPKNFIWLNDDQMIIFESAYEWGDGPAGSPKDYLFDRLANTISPLIENAYLVETTP